MGGLLPDSCGRCGVPFPGGSGRDHFTCPTCGGVNGGYLIGPREPESLPPLTNEDLMREVQRAAKAHASLPSWLRRTPKTNEED